MQGVNIKNRNGQLTINKIRCREQSHEIFRQRGSRLREKHKYEGETHLRHSRTRSVPPLICIQIIKLQLLHPVRRAPVQFISTEQLEPQSTGCETTVFVFDGLSGNIPVKLMEITDNCFVMSNTIPGFAKLLNWSFPGNLGSSTGSPAEASDSFSATFPHEEKQLVCLCQTNLRHFLYGAPSETKHGLFLWKYQILLRCWEFVAHEQVLILESQVSLKSYP